MRTLLPSSSQALSTKAVAFAVLYLEKFDSTGTTGHVFVLVVTQLLAGQKGVPARGSPSLDETPPTVLVGVDVPQSAHGICKKKTHCLGLAPLDSLE